MQDFERERIQTGLESTKAHYQKCLERIKKKERKMRELKVQITKTEKELSQQIINRGVWEKDIARYTQELLEHDQEYVVDVVEDRS